MASLKFVYKKEYELPIRICSDASKRKRNEPHGSAKILTQKFDSMVKAIYNELLLERIYGASLTKRYYVVGGDLEYKNNWFHLKVVPSRAFAKFVTIYSTFNVAYRRFYTLFHTFRNTFYDYNELILSHSITSETLRDVKGKAKCFNTLHRKSKNALTIVTNASEFSIATDFINVILSTLLYLELEKDLDMELVKKQTGALHITKCEVLDLRYVLNYTTVMHKDFMELVKEKLPWLIAEVRNFEENRYKVELRKLIEILRHYKELFNTHYESMKRIFKRDIELIKKYFEILELYAQDKIFRKTIASRIKEYVAGAIDLRTRSDMLIEFMREYLEEEVKEIRWK